MKKIMVLFITFSAMAVIAGPRGPYPGPHCGRGWDRRGPDRGLWNAVAITGIVANGLSIVNSITQPAPVYVAPPVVYSQPVQYVAPAPVYVAPRYIPPAPVYVPPVYVAPAPVYVPVQTPPVPGHY